MPVSYWLCGNILGLLHKRLQVQIILLILNIFVIKFAEFKEKHLGIRLRTNMVDQRYTTMIESQVVTVS